MARRRYNGLATGAAGSLTAASLSGSHTNSTTTLTFNAALTYNNGTAVPTLSGGDHFMLSILDATGQLAEIVKVTAYTSGGTTATVVRGQEGTSGVAHSSGAKVVHAATSIDGGPIAVYKTVDETVNNLATVQDDDELSFFVGANEVWHANFVLYMTAATATPDMKFTVSIPSGASVLATAIQGFDPAVTSTIGSMKSQSFNAISAMGVGVPASTTADAVALFFATISNGATAGRITLQWSQNTANASNSTLRAGSNVLAYRLA